MYKTSTCRATGAWRVATTTRSTNNRGSAVVSPSADVSTTFAPAMPAAKEPLNKEQQMVITVASNVVEQCKEHMESPLLMASLTMVRQLMESLLSQHVQAVPEKDLLKPIFKATKNIASVVKNMCKMHTAILFMELPHLLYELAEATGDLYMSLLRSPQLVSPILTKWWKDHQTRIQHLFEDARFQKSFLLSPANISPVLPAPLEACIVTDEARTELVRVVQRHKRKLFQRVMSEQSEQDQTKRDQAQEALEYMGKFLDKLATAKLSTEADGAVVGSAGRFKMDMDVSCRSYAELDASRRSSISDVPFDGDASVMSLSSMLNSNHSPKQALPLWALCPISKLVMMDPVTVHAECRHTLSLSVLKEWLHVGNKTCPVCGTRLYIITNDAGEKQSGPFQVNEELQMQIAERLEQQEENRLLFSTRNDHSTNVTRVVAAQPSTETFPNAEPSSTSEGGLAPPKATFGRAVAKLSLFVSGQDDLSSTSFHCDDDDNSSSSRNKHSYQHMVDAFDKSNIQAGGTKERHASTVDKKGVGDSLDDSQHSMTLAEAFSGLELSLHRSQDDEFGSIASLKTFDNKEVTSLDQLFSNHVLKRETTTGSQATEIVDNRAITSSVGNSHKYTQSRSRNKYNQNHDISSDAMDASSNMSVRFSTTIVTHYHDSSHGQWEAAEEKPTHIDKINDILKQNPGAGHKEVAASYLMVDRKNVDQQQKKQRKNSIVKLVSKMLKPGKKSDSTKIQHPASTGKGMTYFNDSQGTAMTVSMSSQSDGSHIRGNQAVDSSSELFITSRGRSLSPKRKVTQKKNRGKTRDLSEPPSLVPLPPSMQ